MSYNWQRFWAERGTSLPLTYDGYPDIGKKSAFFASGQNPFIASDKLPDSPCLILLGEPGMGKSTTIKTMAKNTPNAKYFPLRGSSGTSLEKELMDCIQKHETLERFYLFIDDFDECHLQIKNLAQILNKQFSQLKEDGKLTNLYVRIACRTAVWPVFFENELKELWGESNYQAYELAPLTKEDILSAAEQMKLSAQIFVEEVTQKGVVAFAIKPVTLKMLFTIYQKEGQLPKTKEALYKQGCLELCTEDNPSRQSSGLTGKLEKEARLEIAGRIAAATIFANRLGIWTGKESEAPEESLPIEVLFGPEIVTQNKQTKTIGVYRDEVMEVLDTGLFSSASQETGLLGWAHYTYAEFLAAYYVYRRLTMPQIKSLLWGADNQLIPQLQQTAVWLVGLRPELFDDIVSTDPHVLLASDSLWQEVANREKAVSALLASFDTQETDIELGYWHMANQFAKLKYSGLAEQLKPYLDDRSKNDHVRILAIDLAKRCQLTELTDRLTTIALDSGENFSLRKKAVTAVAQLNDENAKARLKPLALVPDTHGEANDLKYTVIEALWPHHLTAHELFTILPSVIRLETSYFLYSGLPKIMNTLLPADLPFALAWVANLPHFYELSPYMQRAVDLLLVRAWENLEAVGVLTALAQALLKHTLNHERISELGFGRSHHGKTFAQKVQEDALKRHLLLKQIISIIAPHWPPEVWLGDFFDSQQDFPWLVDQLEQTSESSRQQILVDIISFTNWGAPENVARLYAVYEAFPLLNEKLDFPFEPILLDSDRAKEKKARHDAWVIPEKERQERLTEQALKQEQGVAEALQKCANGDTRFWQKLVFACWNYRSFSPTSPLTQSDYWEKFSEEIRQQVGQYAKQYLQTQWSTDTQWLETNSIPNSILYGYQALVLLETVEPDFEEYLDTDAWAAWLAILLFFANETPSNLLQLAYRKAPQAFIETLYLLVTSPKLDRANDYLACVDWLTDQKLDQKLLDYLRNHSLPDSISRDLLGYLLRKNDPPATKFAYDTISRLHKSDTLEAKERLKAIAIDVWLHAPEVNWGILWQIFQHDVSLAKAIVEGVVEPSYVHAPIPNSLTEVEMADLFIWLNQAYPAAEDPVHESEEVYSPTVRDNIHTLKNTLLSLLVERGEVAEIEKIARAFPEESFGGSLRMAKKQKQRLSWQPLQPTEIWQLTADNKQRVVQDERHLLAVVLESLARLQTKLTGKDLPLAKFLWNVHKPKQKKGEAPQQEEYTPKEETDLSDYVTAHLRDDLKTVIINREVEIDGGNGRTDIRLETFPLDHPQEKMMLIIEVKGCFNVGVMTNMKTQLVEDYLHKNPACQTGLYLVGWYDAIYWQTTGSCKQAIEVLREELAAQAKVLSIDGLTIASYVLDISLRPSQAQQKRQSQSSSAPQRLKKS